MRELAEFVKATVQRTERIALKMEGVPPLEHAYDMGRDYCLNGVNELNCQFYLFRTRELTKMWEKGRDDARGARGKDVPVQRS